MKKRSMLAVTSLAAGMAVAALSPAPAAHAVGLDGALDTMSVLDDNDVLGSVLDNDDTGTGGTEDRNNGGNHS